MPGTEATPGFSRVAVVTGGAGGLGAAMVKRFVDDGLDVVVADLDATGRVPAGDRVTAVDVDVSRPESAEAMAHAVLDRHGRLDVLVNNAGIAGQIGRASCRERV